MKCHSSSFPFQRFNLLTFQRPAPSHSCRLTIAILTLALSTLNSALAQGSLTPPGPPGATMLTLSQLQPRTPISSAPITITQSGSYYLATNVTVGSGNAITIHANNVMLDLNGFAISSTENPAATGCGIFAGGVTNFTIFNGFISSGVTNSTSGVYGGSGFGYGIFCTNTFNALARAISVSGCLYDGLYLDINNSSAQFCAVSEAGSFGIVALSVSDSTELNCYTGITGYTVNNCVGTGSTQYSIGGTIANNCYGNSPLGIGVDCTIAVNVTENR
ncbi:MAG TPA: hypothetical protein VH280_08480 [Verrucomicrobiae bacterium]|jgi:hypothetical protein|nr:hypothetical protein [Verrucomicrobiae bacterium]